MPLIETDDGQSIHYRTDGQSTNPPLIFSNSLGCDLSMWDRQAERIADRCFVIRYDARGHGGSAVPEGPYTIARLAIDALNLMDALEIHKARWCGLSMGGMVGQWIASHHPERIERLALCNTAAHMPPPDMWNARIDTALNGGGMAALAPVVLERWFTEGFRTDPDKAATLDKLRLMLLSTAPVGYAGCCAAIRDMDQRGDLGRIEAPTLVVTGRQDKSTPPEAAEHLASRIGRSRLALFDACGHISNVEQADAFDATVLPFLTADL